MILRMKLEFNNHPSPGGTMSEPKYRRMSEKATKWVTIMLDSGEWKGSELAELFGISRSRVSQIKKEGAIREEVAPAN